ncbi:hypothetical protein FWD20_00920 [Candidatus Saccharibacteria bacterium]|nr:hypothetical protein [Candidatus Saccharibacteria bacterium]
MKLRFVAVALAFMGLLSLGSGVVSATSPIMTIKPARITIDLEANKTSEDTFEVINRGDVAFSFKLYVSPYSETDGVSDFGTQKNSTLISRWIEIESVTIAGTVRTFLPGEIVENIPLEPDETAQVKFVVNVPSDIEIGYQSAVIFAETETAAEAVSGSYVDNTYRIGVIITANDDAPASLDSSPVADATEETAEDDTLALMPIIVASIVGVIILGLMLALLIVVIKHQRKSESKETTEI